MLLKEVDSCDINRGYQQLQLFDEGGTPEWTRVILAFVQYICDTRASAAGRTLTHQKRIPDETYPLCSLLSDHPPLHR